MPTLCVLMWYNEWIRDYADINYEINKKYCEKYGHTLVRSHERHIPHRSPQWERIPLLLKYIYGFDYVLWIDADAHFYLDAPDIMSVVHSFPEKLFIFSADYNAQQAHDINSGVLLLRQNPDTIAFLTEWAYNEEYFQNRTGYMYEGKYYLYCDQGALQYMYQQNVLDVQPHSVILPYGVLQHFRKEEVFPSLPFIHHLAGSSSTNRVCESTEYWASLSAEEEKHKKL